MTEGMNYRMAGVDIGAGEETVERIKRLAQTTFRPEVLAPLGGFGGLFALQAKQCHTPVLVAGCDGVGTKLKIAFALNRHDSVGIDCVAMSVNDVLVQGAEPLFFLDYLAVGKLNPGQAEQVVAGVAQGCRLAGCALLGGEMAEMPGFYAAGEYDLAGFAVGVVEKARLIDGSAIEAGDLLVGLASAGLHSNGFSLARAVLLERAALSLEQAPPGLDRLLGEELLRPTRIYVRSVLPLLKEYTIKGMAHITGGGLPGNLSRILPPERRAEVWEGAWEVPPVFRLIETAGPVEREEMYRTFNMGVGLVLVLPAEEAEAAVTALECLGECAFIMGRIVPGPRGLVFTGKRRS